LRFGGLMRFGGLDKRRLGKRYSHRQTIGEPTPDLLPGTLELLILKSLVRGPLHGCAVAQRLKDLSYDGLQVGESSLYPALQRLLLKGWVKAGWGASEDNRCARYYTLTASDGSNSASNTRSSTISSSRSRGC
jgi:PadR family transcriptional regulator PadR